MSCCNNFGFRHERFNDRFDPYGRRCGYRGDCRRFDRRRGFRRGSYFNCSGRRCGYYDFYR